MDSNLLVLGLVAGLTIFLGLPIAILPKITDRIRVFLNAVSVGILLFLMIEIMEKVLENAESVTISGLTGQGSINLIFPLLYLFAFGLGLILLEIFEKLFMKNAKSEAPSPQQKVQRVALMIALGIGLHNFSEGLAIGQEYIAGAVKLALILAIGFGLHNATEGFGIAAPLGGYKPRLRYLLLLGLIGGGPTLLGTMVGSIWYNTVLEMFFLSMAGGAILYVIGELWHIGKKLGDFELTLMFGLLIGFVAAFGTDIFIRVAGG